MKGYGCCHTYETVLLGGGSQGLQRQACNRPDPIVIVERDCFAAAIGSSTVLGTNQSFSHALRCQPTLS